MFSLQRPFVSSLLAACLACAGTHSAGVSAPASSAQIHQFVASEAGLSVNCYVVESQHGLVAIDSALTVSDAHALRAKLDALGKPLLAVLLTHGHPDHYNGVFYLIQGRSVPVYATAAVARVIRDADLAKQEQWQPVFGAEWPPERAFPDHELADGDALAFDGLTFVVHDLGPGESHADAYWELQGAERAAFIGDVVLNGEHAYTNDGHTAAWLANLARLAHELSGMSRLYPGHGPAGSVAMLDWEKDYLTRYRAEVDALRAGSERLSDADKQTLDARLTAAYPDAGLEFMISLGADSVASELWHAERKAGEQ
jgi:glyoxylase-like metal-dependent hydrolase (beta-lactamase superfamily II)